MTTANRHLVDGIEPITIDTSTTDGMAVLKLATDSLTSCSLLILVHRENEEVPKLDYVTGDLTVRAKAGSQATISFSTIMHILRSILLPPTLNVECPVEAGPGVNVHSIAKAIDSTNGADSATLTFPVPIHIHHQSIGARLLLPPHNWAPRPAPNGPMKVDDHTTYRETSTVSYLDQNRISFAFVVSYHPASA